MFAYRHYLTFKSNSCDFQIENLEFLDRKFLFYEVECSVFVSITRAYNDMKRRAKNPLSSRQITLV